MIARGFLSRGFGTKDDGNSNLIRAFPKEDELRFFPSLYPGVYVRKVENEGFVTSFDHDDWHQFRIQPVAMLPGQHSRLYGTYVPLPRLVKPKRAGGEERHEAYIYAVTSSKISDGGLVRPWLIGHVTYTDTLGNLYRTNFCIEAQSDGSAAPEGPPPYNEQT